MTTATPIQITQSMKKVIGWTVYLFVIGLISLIVGLLIPTLILVFLGVILFGTGVLFFFTNNKSSIRVDATGVTRYDSASTPKTTPFAEIYKVTFVKKYVISLGQRNPIPHPVVMFSDHKGHEIFYAPSTLYAVADLQRLFNSFDPSDRSELESADGITLFEQADKQQ